VRSFALHASISDAELNHLADAVRFRPLVIAARELARAGRGGRIDAAQVQKRMGHRSATETLDTYAAIFDAADDLTGEEAVGMLARLAASLDTPLTVPLRASEAE
jgi:integrase